MLAIRPRPVNGHAPPQPPPVTPPPDAWVAPDARGRLVQGLLYALAGKLFPCNHQRRE
jgi:hypothetical protein